MTQPLTPKQEQQDAGQTAEIPVDTPEGSPAGGPVDNCMVKQWKLLIPAVTWVMAMIGGFWLPAPAGLVTEDTKAMVSFAKYLATISTGIMILPILKWSTKRHAWLWSKIAGVAAVLSIVAFLSYLNLEDAWTVKHGSDVL
jgi:hypothetical protein